MFVGTTNCAVPLPRKQSRTYYCHKHCIILPFQYMPLHRSCRRAL
jgi:hypothetical protein